MLLRIRRRLAFCELEPEPVLRAELSSECASSVPCACEQDGSSHSRAAEGARVFTGDEEDFHELIEQIMHSILARRL